MITNRESESIRPESVLRRMERMIGGAVKGKKNKHAAQELVYDAWEAMSDEKEYELLERAVELDSTNVDAWLGLMDFAHLDDDERIEMLRKLVAMGGKNLGKKIFKNDKGHFWGLLETRPYMRARSQLAFCLMEMKRFEESILEYEAMLELNPNDNQGVRYALMSCYLSVGNLEGARRLFVHYDEREFSTVWAWAYVLERFLSDDLKGAEKALWAAFKQNPHAQNYFQGYQKLPKSMPGSYCPGSREEAIIARDILRPAWKKHPKIQSWLKSQKVQK